MAKASRIVSALSFTFDEGIVLGDHYKVKPVDAPNKLKMESQRRFFILILIILNQLLKGQGPILIIIYIYCIIFYFKLVIAISTPRIFY